MDDLGDVIDRKTNQLYELKAAARAVLAQWDSVPRLDELDMEDAIARLRELARS